MGWYFLFSLGGSVNKGATTFVGCFENQRRKNLFKADYYFFLSWWISPVGSSPKAAQDRWCWEGFPLAPAIEATSTLVLGSVSPEISFHHATLRLLNNLWRICLRRCNFATDINLCLNGASASSSNFDWDSLPKVFRTSSSSMSTYDALMALV